jgi:hypothetical protein
MLDGLVEKVRPVQPAPELIDLRLELLELRSGGGEIVGYLGRPWLLAEFPPSVPDHLRRRDVFMEFCR